MPLAFGLALAAAMTSAGTAPAAPTPAPAAATPAPAAATPAPAAPAPAPAATVTSAGRAAAAPAPLPSNCTQAGTTSTCTFTAAGESTFTVPFSVSSVTATVVGAQGGSDGGNSVVPGGLGAQATGTLSVIPGQTLYVEVGVRGGPGGAIPGTRRSPGAGGGGSDVRTRGCPPPGQPCVSGSTLSSRLLVAGGDGGVGSYSGPGGNAGTTGAAGDGSPGAAGDGCNAGAGGGATPLKPGTGGAGCGNGLNGTDGAAGTGGTGGGPYARGVLGGGGGGGWYGGGGGGGGAGSDINSAGAGGGGSSYASPSVRGESFTQAAAGQAPSVTLTFTNPCVQSGATSTCTYTAAGEGLFVVPPGVNSVNVTAVGGGGWWAAGLGALVTGTIPVTPGQTLYANVNVLGGAPNGGGESDVRTCSASASCDTLHSRLLVAGGGGGPAGNPAYGNGVGGNAGTNGDAGDDYPGNLRNADIPGGGGATRTAPGKAGNDCSPDASDGAFGVGGAADPGDPGDRFGAVTGGGGGGGWYGGAGGCSSPALSIVGAGGGGGSSYADPSVTEATFTLADAGQAPSVTISYPLPLTSEPLPESAIQINTIAYDSPGRDTGSTRSLNNEWIRLTNTGRTTQQLGGWSIRDEDGNIYRFKHLLLRPHAAVTLHSGHGRDRAADRYWNQRGYIWDNTGELASLYRPDGSLADTCRYDNAHGKSAKPHECNNGSES